jgi:catechol 2,3-dioxygenase-like lactoylglutathione lyase family enzyme
MTFAHLTIATRDVEATADFYEKTLGWKRVGSPANSPIEVAWVQMGPRQQLHVLRRDDFEPWEFETEFGRHFAVFHPGADFAGLKQRLLQHGGRLIDPIRPTPFERFFFKDPNGYMFEVIDEQHYVQE